MYIWRHTKVQITSILKLKLRQEVWTSLALLFEHLRPLASNSDHTLQNFFVRAKCGMTVGI